MRRAHSRQRRHHGDHIGLFSELAEADVQEGMVRLPDLTDPSRSSGAKVIPAAVPG